MAIEAITHPAEWREGQILRHREGIDVADPGLSRFPDEAW